MEFSELLIDPKRLIRLARGARLRWGNVRAEGLPAIFLGIGAIIVATGVSRALAAAAQALAARTAASPADGDRVLPPLSLRRTPHTLQGSERG